MNKIKLLNLLRDGAVILIMLVIFIIVFALFAVIPITLLWNAILTDLFGLPIIDLHQTAGLVVLVHLLFPGFIINKTNEKLKDMRADGKFGKAEENIQV